MKQKISGDLTGDLTINLTQLSLIGSNLAVSQPVITNLHPLLDKIQGEKFTGNLRYQNGIAIVENGILQKGNTKYSIVNGEFQSSKFKANINVEKATIAEVEDLFPVVKKLDLQDLFPNFKQPKYAKINVLNGLIGVGEDNIESLEDQIFRVSEIDVLLGKQRKQRKQNYLLPELRDLNGSIDGTILVENSPETGLKADFNLLGNNWQWGEYKANKVMAIGSWNQGILTVKPIEITGDQSLISFSGSVGGQEYNGKVKLNLPARILSERFDLPIDITGKLDSEVTLGGNINNPQAIGELNLLDGTLNGESFESILLSFSYNDSRLNFSTKNSEQNLTISGNFPYKLTEKQVTPNNNFAVKVDVKNEGFSLLNLLTRRQVVWQKGEGKLNLSVTGSFNPENSAENSIIAKGDAEIKNATIKGQVFPEPLTDVNGNISFDFDKIQVQNFQGKFSGGEVNVTGGIPIFNPVNSDDNLGLNIDITKKLAFNLKGIYNGSVRGNIGITGTAIAPKIGGDLELFDGFVYLTEKTPQFLSNNNNKDSLNSTPTEFNNLKIRLTKNVQVVQPPILNFLAKGDLTINGNLDSIRPQGKIELERGSVNLFTTELRLVGGYPNQAKFFPEQGLIPTLDVKLQTSVSEVVRNSLAINPNLTDINEKSATNLGSLQTVRIQANVQGITNQLTTDNLELISSPPRSKSEIVSLLGGGFVQNLVEPGNRSLGVANIITTPILGNIQNVVGNALGLTEFRLFPTIVTDNSNKQENSILGVGAELGFDITNNVSTSILKVLTVDQSPLLNLRYRVNNEILLRGATNLQDDNRFLFEYESRF